MWKICNLKNKTFFLLVRGWSTVSDSRSGWFLLLVVPSKESQNLTAQVGNQFKLLVGHELDDADFISLTCVESCNTIIDILIFIIGNFPAPPSTPEIYENLHVIDVIDFEEVDRVWLNWVWTCAILHASLKKMTQNHKCESCDTFLKSRSAQHSI